MSAKHYFCRICCLIDEVDALKNKATNSIAQNIKKYRLLNNMTQEQLANALYLDTQYYAQLERGERNFTIEKIILACTIFHVGIENIIVIEDTSVNDNSELLEKIIHDIVFNQNTLIHGKTKPRSHLKRNRGFASILITRKLSLSGSVQPDFDLKSFAFKLPFRSSSCSWRSSWWSLRQ